ncbi:hypothetical protein E2562_023970 [Oryza meyeriana var. granulata]|uniref:Uncharacterized protein n=1 Tax=Oryza meyeriana var. granulata TaxID=110450 RepID=A0A6G1BZA0_9ORYZ|nr:hypothetical protein E2562_023970 [Oryza meyeriana var. granulata]
MDVDACAVVVHARVVVEAPPVIAIMVVFVVRGLGEPTAEGQAEALAPPAKVPGCIARIGGKRATGAMAST